MKMTFRCGHLGCVPSNMGRSAARQRRLAEYFGHRCFDCVARGMTATYEKLTYIDGTIIGLENPKLRAKLGVKLAYLKRFYRL